MTLPSGRSIVRAAPNPSAWNMTSGDFVYGYVDIGTLPWRRFHSRTTRLQLEANQTVQFQLLAGMQL
jgi:hypothetical protein